MFKDYNPGDLPLKERHQLLIGAIGPRPIAFVGSLSAEGVPNLAPFSFFNAFGANPVTICISPAYSGRTGQPKDTMLNIKATGEFTVSMVSYSMVRQMQLTAGEYPAGVNEFDVSGLMPLPSVKIEPPGVEESPFVMECSLDQHIELGGGKGSGNLLLGKVLTYRIREDVLDEDGRIDPRKMDQVGRLGGGWYTRAVEGLFSIDRRQTDAAIGFDALPDHLLKSTILTGNDLAQLAGVAEIPRDTDLSAKMETQYGGLPLTDRHLAIKALIEAGKINDAWAIAGVGEKD